MTEPISFESQVNKNSKEWQFLLTNLKKQIDKKSKAVIKSGDDLQHLLVGDFVTTGSMNLDIIMNGGVVPGRIYEYFGAESSGKTTMALIQVKKFQLTDPRKAVIIDAEHSLNLSHILDLNIDTSRLVVVKPDTGEEAMVLAETIIKSGLASIVVLDSIAALVPKDEQDKGLDAATMGKLGALMSKTLRSFSQKCDDARTTFLMINQIRSTMAMYGPPETSPGGWAQKFFSTGRLKVKRVGFITDKNKEIIGQEIEVTVEKNKLGPAKRSCVIRFIYGQQEFEVLEEVADIILKIPNSGLIAAGAWIKAVTNMETEETVVLGQGKSSLVELFRNNPAFFEEAKRRISAYYKEVPSARPNVKFDPFNLEEIKQPSDEVSEPTQE